MNVQAEAPLPSWQASHYPLCVNRFGRDEERRALALLALAMQGEQSIAEGRFLSLDEHRQRMAALLGRDGAINDQLRKPPNPSFSRHR